MTLLSGAISASSIGNIVSPQLSGNLGDYDVDYWPTGQAIAASASGAFASYTRPVSANPRAIAGRIASSYFNDYYNRVHITPTSIALGNLLNNQSRSVAVWNAYIDQSLTLQSVATENADGIVATPPDALPLTFAPLQEIDWQITINITGSAVINATLTWQFESSADDVTLTISGNRTIAWTALPDWGSAGVTETLEWLTDVLAAPSGPEQRRKLRIAPRRTFEFDVWLDAQTHRIMEAQLFQWSSQVWALPIWPDGILLAAGSAPGDTTITTDTTDLDYVDGGLAIILASTTVYEIVQIQTVSDDALLLSQPTTMLWAPNSARIFPMRTARLSAFPQLTRSTDDRSTVTPSFQINEPCDWPASFGNALYRTFPVLEMRPDETQDPTATYNRVIVTTDSTTGVLAVDDTAGSGQPLMGYRYLMQGAAARAAYRSLLYALAGRWSTIWIPTWNQDLLVTLPVAIGNSTINVEWTGYTRFLLGQMGRQDIRIELMDGTVRYRRIVNAIELSDSTEQLAIDTPMDIPISLAAIRAVSYLTPFRSDSDKVTIIHEHDNQGVANSDVTWRADLHVI